jgi:hypothetical protein
MVYRIMRSLFLGLLALLALGGGAQAQSCSGLPNANTLCGGPSSGGAGFPGFRAQVNGDLPTSPANSVKGSIAGGAPADLTATQLTTLCNTVTGSLSGCVPSFPNTVTTFFRGDGTYNVPPTVTSGAPGYAPAFPNNTTTFFRGDGTYATVSPGALTTGTRGSILEQGAGGWAAIAPGTSGFPWVSNGTGADPAYQACGLNGGCLGGSQAGATANQIPVFPGSSGAAVPTSAATWFDNAYCNTVGWAIVRFTSAWTCSKFIAANPVWWGADPTGVSDSTTAFNSAASAVSSTGSIEFPAGKFRFNSALSLTLPNSLASVTVKGQGQDVTTLFWPNAAGGLTINYVNALNTAHVRDLSFTTGQAGGGTGLTFTSSAVSQGIPVSDIYRVTLRGDDGYNVADYWSTGVLSHNVSNLNVDGLMVQGVGSTGSGTLHGIGMQSEGAPALPGYAVVVNVAKGVFQNLNTGILYGSYLQGLTVDQTNFTIVQNGIISNASETGTLGQLAVTNSQFGLFNNVGGGIVTATAIAQTQIANNFFFINSTASNVSAISLTLNNHFNIVGNQITSLTTTGTNGIVIGTTTAGAVGVISANDIFGFNVGLTLQAGSLNTRVEGNTLEGNTGNISLAGTGHTGLDLPSQSFAASPSCGTATFTTTTKQKVSGKQTWVTADILITAIGTCASVLTFTLPNTANSAAAIVGQEFANGTNLRDTVVCLTGGSTATCVKQTNHAYAVNDHFQVSGVYENQ